MTRQDAQDLITQYHIPTRDFHTLSTGEVEQVLAAADLVKYRKPRSANGSRARYFHARLIRLANKEA